MSKSKDPFAFSLPPQPPDRSNLCTFTFSDGRQCTMNQSSDDMGLCYYHAQRYLNALKKNAAGRKAGFFVQRGLNTACDLSAAFSQLFCSTAQGQIKPKTAAALASIGRLLVQAHLLSKKEFASAFEDPWPELVQQSLIFGHVPKDPSDTLVTVGPDPYADKYPYDDANKIPRPGLVKPGPISPNAMLQQEKTTVSFPRECTPQTLSKSTDLM